MSIVADSRINLRDCVFFCIELLAALLLVANVAVAEEYEFIGGWEVSGRSCKAADGEVVHCDAKKPRQQVYDDPHEIGPVEALAPVEAEPKDLIAEKRGSSLVNVYFLGRWIATTRINYDAENLQFEIPKQLLDSLTGVYRLEEVAELLKEALPLNTDLVCNPWREKRECGWLNTEALGVIYDAKRLRVDLFLAESFLNYRARYSDLYLPEARPRKTSIISARAVATRLDQENSGVYSTANGFFSYGEGNLSLNADCNSESDLYRIRTFSLTHYFRDHEVQAGTFSYSPSGYLANLDIMGLRWNSSTKSRRNVASLLSSDVEIFLPRRSIVQLAIGDRVYTGASYEAGSHNLDTSMLPEGTYELDIIINDPDSGTRVETRLHTRSPLLPPAGQGKYGFMLGAPVDRGVTEKYPQREQDVVFAADYAQRLYGRTAWRLGFMQMRQDSLLQGELIHFNRNTLWKARLLAGESDTYGLGFSVAYKNGWFSSKLDADHYDSHIDFEAAETKALRTLLASGFTQVIASISRKKTGDTLHRSVGEIGVQFALDGDGTAAGGMAFTGSGVIIDVSGEPVGSGFDIFANGSRVRSGRVGSTHFVSLKPFKDYTLKLVPRAMNGNGIDRREHSFTLYPGNVERVRTHTVPQYHLITTLVDQAGGPIGGAMVECEGAMFPIETDGALKIMVSPGEILNVKLSEEKYCLVVTPVVNSLDALVSDRPLVCFIDPVVN